MTTYNKLPYSNQFERGHSFNWAGHWKPGKYYYNNSYVTDFVVCDNMILVCRKDHMSSEELKPEPIMVNGEITDVKSSHWEFILSPNISNKDLISSSEFIANATDEDFNLDPSVIIGYPYIKLCFESDRYLYIPVHNIIQQYKVGVPILTTEMYNDLPSSDKPDPYILIPSETDVTEANNGNYLNILFSAIRSLQAEVSKLKNSFQYGIQSYVGTDTTMSEVVDQYKYRNDEEPLWSIEEDALAEITEATINLKSAVNIPPFVPISNFEYNGNGVVKINDYVTWSDLAGGFLNNLDSKILLYLTATDLNIDINLSSIDSDLSKSFNISQVSDIFNSNSEKYNICVLISRKIASDIDSSEKYGKNYVWLSIGTYNTNQILTEGYLDFEYQNLSQYRIELSDAYTIESVGFSPMYLYKFNGYSKYQDFSHEVIPSKPNDDDYKYHASHITIRAVKDFSTLESIETQLLENELVWQIDESKLWIKSKNGLSAIGSSSNPEDSGMTVDEMIEKLSEMGIVYTDSEGLQLSSISDVTFINEDTNKKFNFKVNNEGNLISTEIPEKTLQQRINDLTGVYAINKTDSYRGFISKLLAGEAKIDATPSTNIKDLKLNSDRLKIGAVYCPLKTDTKFGCSHGYIELENTSDKNIPLDGCYLHFLHPDSSGNLRIEHLELNGQIYGGGTYLIRCKQYANKNLDADIFISVDTYDKEWYINGELLDISIDTSNVYAFALTYGNSDNSSAISSSTYFITKKVNNDSKAPHNYKWYFIDSIVFNANPKFSEDNACWALNVLTPKSNTIVKTTFELDPAKQAYQGLTTYESSRIRMDKPSTDIQYLNLNKEYIEFPHSEEKYPIRRYTPKSSKEHKNVSTDKTKLNKDKPNMVTCSFGINMYTTRTFNWISCGQFDEYVWLKINNAWYKFSSYTKYKDGDPTETTGTYPRRKNYNQLINDTVYARITRTFPGDLSVYTSHKCIIEITNTVVQEPTTYTYIVGRADKNGNPDFEHCSDEYTFTIYPTSYTPRIYQTTDQQGFHWIEYQVWAAAANTINSKIISDCQNEHIIPVLLNTGDMTQNGTRINEWLDYYNGGINLFKHLEQVNCVGNNDLCNTDPEILGTGDDNGKSNSFYFHVFYCYEIDTNIVPIIQGDDDVYRYIPSLYYINSLNYRFIIVNSEITYANCDQWFNKHKNNTVVNVYTGWCVPSVSTATLTNEDYDSSFTTIYSMVYTMLNTAGNRNKIAICHEMPFTVITKEGLNTTTSVKANYRSLSGSGSSLIGSHTNQLNGYDKVGIHWFSRLLEYFNVKLCLGGHKHTYACTFPLCEYYYYGDNKNSLDHGPMTMESTLANDLSTIWINEGVNLTKLPLIDSTYSSQNYSFEGGNSEGNNHFSPATLVSNLNTDNIHHPVVYMMCQATGYKLTSNKELPSLYQHFSMIIPKTTEGASGGSDDADGNQKFPMFTITDMNENSYTVKLVRIQNIMTGGKFNQSTYEKGAPYFQYGYPNQDKDNRRYCVWSTTETNLISI